MDALIFPEGSESEVETLMEFLYRGTQGFISNPLAQEIQSTVYFFPNPNILDFWKKILCIVGIGHIYRPCKDLKSVDYNDEIEKKNKKLLPMGK